jgi:hypothetical protein
MDPGIASVLLMLAFAALLAIGAAIVEVVRRRRERRRGPWSVLEILVRAIQRNDHRK